ncbi:MAG TPA: endonuclease/exonuclease/phosphatase family protein, partial [Bacteroidales bacterium]|nr:endonuclease/exonuclease/phosphatase family protein [Bacteroidales bacterium]
MKKILYKILLALNIAFGTALLLAYLAVHINPADFALPAIFGLAYPWILLSNLVIAVLWAIMLRPETLISVFLIALGFNHFTNYLKLGKPGEDKTATFKVLSYNVRLFNRFEGRGTADSEKQILDFLRDQKPDIICLQEFYFPGNPTIKEQSFTRALGGKYYSHL